jgi:hypothetical protein
MTEYLQKKNAISLWTTEVKNDFLLHQLWESIITDIHYPLQMLC